MDVVAELTRLGGAARRTEIAGTARRRSAVAAAVARGGVRDLGGGWVAAVEADPAVVAARRLGGTVTCVSAAAFYGLRLLTAPQCPHVAVPRDRGPRSIREPVRRHRESRWTRPSPRDLPVAPLEEVLARVLRCWPLREAVVVVDSALQKRLVTAEEISRMLRGPGSTAALAALERCNGRSRSAIETLARLALEDAGLRVDAGVVMEGVGEVDLLVEGLAVVECDGFAYHSGRKEYRQDRRRDRALAARGYVVLRFTWEEIMDDAGVVVGAVRQVLGRH